MTDSFVPLFSSIVDSSLWDEDDFVIKVFITMWVLQDPDHVVRRSAYAIASRSRKTEKEVLEALVVLASPDTKRLEPQPNEGRRIEKVDGVGWKILNAEKYQDAMRALFRRAANAERMRMKRAADKLAAATKGKGPTARETAYCQGRIPAPNSAPGAKADFEPRGESAIPSEGQP